MTQYNAYNPHHKSRNHEVKQEMDKKSTLNLHVGYANFILNYIIPIHLTSKDFK